MGTIATVTIGSDDFSVYALTSSAVADATSWFNGRLGAGATAWAAASADDKARALVMASDWIDRALGPFFTGAKTVSTQAREWPRDGATCDGTAITDGTTPDSLAYATFFLAGELLQDASAAAGTGTGLNVKKAKAGSAEVEFFSSTLGGASDTRLPVTAMDYLGCLTSAGTSITGFSSGARDSDFCETDFERSEGYA
jgi:hypothetical protein